MRRPVAAALSVAGATVLLLVSLYEPYEGFSRFQLDFGLAPVSVDADDLVQIELRPPHLEWWLGWKMDGCAVHEDQSLADGLGVFRCFVDFPTRWGCAEVISRTSRIWEDDDGKKTAEFSTRSNVLVAGTCPDPMPDRVPLATPTPTIGLGLACGVMSLGWVGSRHRRPHR